MVDEAYSPVVISRKDARALGLKHYFTGKPCKRGHLTIRHVIKACCCSCLKEDNAAQRLKNHDRNLERGRAYESANRDKRREKDRRYRNVNKEKRNADSRRWYRENTDKALAYSAEYMKMYRALPGVKEAQAKRCLDYRKRNPDKIKAITRAWNERNKQRKRASERNREARKLGNGGTHTAEDIRDIFRQQRGKCAICAISLKSTTQHVDHIISLAAGGSNDRRNLQILCEPCNLSKGRRDPIDMMRSLGRLL